MSYILRYENRTILIESVSTPTQANVLMSEPRIKTTNYIIQEWETEHPVLNFFLVDSMGGVSPIEFADAVFYYNKIETDGSNKYIVTYSNGNIFVFTLQIMYRKNARDARRLQDLLIFLEPYAKVYNRPILPYVTGGDGKADLKMKFNQQIETTGAIQNIEQFQIVTSIPTSFYKDTATAPNKIIPVQTVQMRGVFVYIFKASDASTTFSTGTVVVNPTGAIPNPIMAVYTTLPWSYGEF